MATKLSKNGKRLGRPPKNLNKENTGVVFTSPVAVESKKEVFIQVPADVESTIQCDFIPILQSFFINVEDQKKSGRYINTNYKVEGFGKEKWVVGGYLKADWQHYRELKWHPDEIIKRCVNYLNSIVNKKGKKRYGNLELVNYKFINKSGEEVVIIELSTDERKNDNFWGEGERF
jgi:hypothetical protein